MGLKSLLQTWLGMAELKDEIARAKARQITEATLRKEIADALDVVLSGDKQSTRWHAYFPDDGRRFEHLLRRITAEQSGATALSAVEARIGGEAFLDEVVSRLRRKQLDA